MQLDQRGEAKPQSGGVSLRECRAQELVEKKLRFEVGAGDGEFNFADAVAQVQALTLFARRAEKSRQPSAEVGGFADVRLALPAKEEDCGRGGQCGEEGFVVVMIGRECEGVLEHRGIVVRPTQPMMSSRTRPEGERGTFRWPVPRVTSRGYPILHAPVAVRAHRKVPLLAFSQVRDDMAIFLSSRVGVGAEKNHSSRS